jgi:hypothetical protein
MHQQVLFSICCKILFYFIISFFCFVLAFLDRSTLFNRVFDSTNFSHLVDIVITSGRAVKESSKVNCTLAPAGASLYNSSSSSFNFGTLSPYSTSKNAKTTLSLPYTNSVCDSSPFTSPSPISSPALFPTLLHITTSDTVGPKGGTPSPPFSPPPVTDLLNCSEVITSSSLPLPSATSLTSTSSPPKNPLKKTHSATLTYGKNDKNEMEGIKTLDVESNRPASVIVSTSYSSTSNSTTTGANGNSSSVEHTSSSNYIINEMVTYSPAGTPISVHKYSLCIFTSSISLLIDIIWNTKPSKRELDEERRRKKAEKKGKIINLLECSESEGEKDCSSKNDNIGYFLFYFF